MSRKIRILFDAQSMANDKKSGIGYYARELITALADKYPQELILVGHYFSSPAATKADLPSRENIQYKTTKWLPLKLHYQLRRMGLSLPVELLARTRADLILCPDFIGYTSLFKTPVVPVIHDLTYLEHPEYVSSRNQEDLSILVPKTLQKAPFSFAVSDTTKRQLVKKYNLDPQKIIVTLMAAPKPVEPSKNMDSIKKKYVLFLGNLEPRKNFICLAEAFSLLPAELRKTYDLVVAGGNGWQNETDIKRLNELTEIGHNIIQTGYISEPDKAYLYRNASLFVLPSHYEGFGIPLLEAMECEVPVAASNIDIFHEVAGDAAVYFNQNDPSDIAKKIEEVLTDSELRDGLAAKSKTNLERFSWDKTAAIVYKAIESSLRL